MRKIDIKMLFTIEIKNVCATVTKNSLVYNYYNIC